MSIYDCKCGGYATLNISLFVYWRQCNLCHKRGAPQLSKTAANNAWKRKHVKKKRRQVKCKLQRQ